MSSTSISSSNNNNSPESDRIPSKLIRLAKKFNRCYLGSFAKNEYKPLIYKNVQIGLVRGIIENELTLYPDVFKISKGEIQIIERNPEETDEDLLSPVIDEVLRDLRARNPNNIALRGWRNENYEIKVNFSDVKPLFKMERSATCLFGLRQYGVDINGYVNHPEKGLCLWFQRRSKDKPTWPGMWDNFVSGGLSEGLGVSDTAVKEAQEEANVPPDLAKSMKPAGCVTFFFESERGIFPQTEFVFDLELTPDFVPQPNDGEVEEFELLPVQKVLSRVLSPDMKTTSCPITLDFLVRHGIVNASNEPDLPELIELLHVPVHQLYKKNYHPHKTNSSNNCNNTRNGNTEP